MYIQSFLTHCNLCNLKFKKNVKFKYGAIYTLFFLTRMDKNELFTACAEYCKEHNFKKTLEALNGRSVEVLKPNQLNRRYIVTKMFQKYFKKQNPGLSFTFNLKNMPCQLRNRLLKEQSGQAASFKKMKDGFVKDRMITIPAKFLTLLDELGLNKKDAKLLYENKDQWTYVKSDRLLYCSEKSKLRFVFYKCSRL